MRDSEEEQLHFEPLTVYIRSTRQEIDLIHDLSVLYESVKDAPVSPLPKEVIKEALKLI